VCGDDIGFSDLRSTLQSKAPLYEALDKYHRITQIIRRVVSNLRYPDISRYRKVALIYYLTQVQLGRQTWQTHLDGLAA
jgi:hypothetical protein